MRAKSDPLHPSNIARQRRRDRQPLRIVKDPQKVYSCTSRVGYVGLYCILRKHLKYADKELDEKSIIMLKALVKEYARTGVNAFTKAECERLAAGKGSVKWARNRFKILLEKGYLIWRTEGWGVMINFDLVLVEDA